MEQRITNANTLQVSYLRARDPSILAVMHPGLPRVNLALDMLSEESSTPADETIVDKPSLRNIQVYLRVKKVDRLEEGPYELDGNMIHCMIPHGSHSGRNVKVGQYVTRTYKFSQIFGPNSTQEEVFQHTVKPKLLDLLNGINSTLMTYGASGSGKTFTIVGTAEEPGVIPRALEYLFGSLPRLAETPRLKPNLTGTGGILLTVDQQESEKNARRLLLAALSRSVDRNHIHTYQAMQHRLSSEPVAEVEQYKDVTIAVWVSFAEIYNEHIYDLLASEPHRAKVRINLQLGKAGNAVYIKNLRNISISNGLEAYQVLQYGLHNLQYASTAINSHSSRSHCIFSIKLVQGLENSPNNHQISYFNFCDLAGAERSKKTMNAGDRLRESNNINTSLMVLGRCISAIREAQQKNDAAKLIPYRESKLTMLFQNALSGKENVTMIVNVNPTSEMFDESSHVLNFSAIAKEVVVKCDRPPLKRKRTEEENGTEESSESVITHLENEVERLKAIITNMHDEIEREREQIQENLDSLVLQNQAFNDQKRKYWQERLAKAEERYKRDLKLALEVAREEFEQAAGKRKRLESIIVLDSDEEEEEETENQCCKKYKAEVRRLRADYAELKSRLNDNLEVQELSDSSIEDSDDISLDSQVNLDQKPSTSNLNTKKEEDTSKYSNESSLDDNSALDEDLDDDVSYLPVKHNKKPSINTLNTNEEDNTFNISNDNGVDDNNGLNEDLDDVVSDLQVMLDKKPSISVSNTKKEEDTFNNSKNGSLDVISGLDKNLDDVVPESELNKIMEGTFTCSKEDGLYNNNGLDEDLDVVPKVQVKLERNLSKSDFNTTRNIEDTSNCSIVILDDSVQ